MSIKMWCPNVIYSLPERADLTNKSLSSSNTGCSQPPVETRVGLMIPFFVCLFICFLTCHSLTCCQWKLGKLWALSCYPLSWCCIDLVWGILSRSLMGATGFQFCLYYQTHDSQIAPPLCSHAFLSLKPVITVQIGLHAVLWSSLWLQSKLDSMQSYDQVFKLLFLDVILLRAFTIFAGFRNICRLS